MVRCPDRLVDGERFAHPPHGLVPLAKSIERQARVEQRVALAISGRRSRARSRAAARRARSPAAARRGPPRHCPDCRARCPRPAGRRSRVRSRDSARGSSIARRGSPRSAQALPRLPSALPSPRRSPISREITSACSRSSIARRGSPRAAQARPRLPSVAPSLSRSPTSRAIARHLLIELDCLPWLAEDRPRHCPDCRDAGPRRAGRRSRGTTQRLFVEVDSCPRPPSGVEALPKFPAAFASALLTYRSGGRDALRCASSRS